MQDHEYRSLIAKAVAGAGPCWADLGSGDGGFTFALAQLLGDQARLVSVDTRRSALAAQRKRFAASRLRVAIATSKPTSPHRFLCRSWTVC